MQLKFNLNKFCTIIICMMVFCACSKKRNDEKGEVPEPEAPNPNETVASRQTLLENIADHFILPGYANFKVKLEYMDNRRAAFTNKPNDTTLAALRTAWADAYIDWQKIAMFNVGPAETYVPTAYFNSFPTKVIEIEKNILNIPNLDLPSTFSQQGFPALDYLINGLGSDSATIVKYTTATDAAQRITYLTTLTQKMKSLFATINDGWHAGGYRAKFVGNTGVNAGSPLSLLVNAFVYHYEKQLRASKIGIPSDAFGTAGQVYPAEVEAYYKKDLSRTLAKTSQEAVTDVFNGKSFKTGETVFSFKAYLDALGAKDSKTGNSLSSIIVSQFGVVTEKLNVLSDNFSQQIITDNQKMLDAFNAMQSAVRMLKVDMTLAMSVTITYVDSDGD